MPKNVDAVVIGAGPGGSIAGAYLAKAGLKTIVFESTGIIGGPKYGSYTKGGFRGDLCQHTILWAMGSDGGEGWGGWWLRAAHETGAVLRWQCMPNCVLHHKGKFTTIPYCSNGEAYVEFVKDWIQMPIPDSTQKEVAKVFDEALAMSDGQRWYSEESLKMPFKTWVERITSDEVAKQFFAAAASVIMMFPPEFAYQKASTQLMTTSFMAHLCGGRSNLMVMVGDTSDALPKAFCNVATKNGGQVLINHKVIRVIVEEGKAKGVVVRNADGVEETYNAKYVIMSSSYPTFKPLLGENLPGEITEIIKDFDTVDYTLIEVDLGLKRQMAYPWWALVTVLKDDFGYEGAIMANSHYVPTLVPPGKELIQAATFLPTVDYREANKKELVQKVIDMCERVYPGMKDEVEMTSVYVLSPTFHYTYLPGRKVPLECPGISGLYFVGDCTESPGFTTERCASSAMTVAKNILRRGGN